MESESQQESLRTPPNLEGFIRKIDWPDDKNKQHLRDIVAMVREGAQEEWVSNYRKSVEWYQGKEKRNNALQQQLPEELKVEDPLGEEILSQDEYYWLESAVQTAIDAGYVSDRDEARTRLLLARASQI